MPSVEQHLQAKAQAAREKRIADAKLEAKAKLEPLQEHLQRLDRLCANEDLKWFTVTFLQPIHDDAQRGALDVGNSPEVRNNFAQQRHAAEKMLAMLETMTNQFRTALTQAMPS